MKKVFLIFNLLTLFALQAIGQAKSDKVNILWGPEQKEPRKSLLSDIVGYDNTGIYVHKKHVFGLSFSTTAFTLEHYDLNMAPINSAEIELKAEGKVADFETTLYIDNAMYLFSSYANRKLKKYNLYVQLVNKKTLLPEKELRLIAEMDYTGSNKETSGGFNFNISDDSSKVLVYHNLPSDKDENPKHVFYVLDKSMNQLWKKSVTLPYKNELFDVEKYEVDNLGNVHLIGLIFNAKKQEKRIGKPNYKYQILSYYHNGNEFKEYPVNIEGIFLTDMQIAINDKKEIVCGGYYSSEGSFNIEGSYFIKINSQTKEITSKDFQMFSVDFITQHFSDKEEKETKKDVKKGVEPGLFKYALHDIILGEDGTTWLIGEQFYIQQVINHSSDAQGKLMTSTTFIFHHNDIIIINISPDGKIVWSQKIAKRQVDRNEQGIYSSYLLSKWKDKLLFVFNDNAKNITYKGEGKPADFDKDSESIVTLVTIDKQGNQTRESLFALADAHVMIRPSVCEQISAKELVLFGQKKKLHRFAKVTFKEPKQ